MQPADLLAGLIGLPIVVGVVVAIVWCVRAMVGR